MPKKTDIYLTRIIQYFKKLDRIGMIWYGSLICASILLFTTLDFTVVNHEYYKKVADKLQKTTIKNPVSRGTISSSSLSLEGVMAVSTNLGTLAIDPTQTGSIDGLLDFLGDVVFNEYCAHKS